MTPKKINATLKNYIVFFKYYCYRYIYTCRKYHVSKCKLPLYIFTHSIYIYHFHSLVNLLSVYSVILGRVFADVRVIIKSARAIAEARMAYGLVRAAFAVLGLVVSTRHKAAFDSNATDLALG